MVRRNRYAEPCRIVRFSRSIKDVFSFEESSESARIFSNRQSARCCAASRSREHDQEEWEPLRVPWTVFPKTGLLLRDHRPQLTYVLARAIAYVPARASRPAAGSVAAEISAERTPVFRRKLLGCFVHSFGELA